MRKSDRLGWALGAGVAAGLLTLQALAADDGERTLFRHRAPVQIEQPAPFVRLPLAPEVYARSVKPGLVDLRLVDAKGERVPFALLAPRDDELKTDETWRDATLYRLPPRPAGSSASWAAPVELSVDGGRITVRQRGAAVAPERSPGWLADLGERAKDEAAPRTLRLQWSGPAEFSIGYSVEHSADLKSWRSGGSGQLVALAAGTGGGAALTQPDVALPADVARFVRLVWSGSAAPPQLSGARAATPSTRAVALDPPQELKLAASAEPAGAFAGDAAKRALHFDLGAVMPLARLDLQLPSGTRVLPAQVQVRERIDARWEAAAGTVFYRLEPAASAASAASPSAAAVSPPLALHRPARYVRVVVDERAAMPAADSVRLLAQVQLASLVFTAQGEPPLALLAGSADAGPGALPLATLVPELDKERARFGRASLGAWSEQREAAERVQRQQRIAMLKPWLLWTLLIGGVGALALVVWRLARGAGAKAASSVGG